MAKMAAGVPPTAGALRGRGWKPTLSHCIMGAEPCSQACHIHVAWHKGGQGTTPGPGIGSQKVQRIKDSPKCNAHIAVFAVPWHLKELIYCPMNPPYCNDSRMACVWCGFVRFRSCRALPGQAWWWRTVCERAWTPRTNTSLTTATNSTTRCLTR